MPAGRAPLRPYAHPAAPRPCRADVHHAPSLSRNPSARRAWWGNTAQSRSRFALATAAAAAILIEQCFDRDATPHRDDRQVDRCGVAEAFSSSSPRPRAGAVRERARGGSSSRRGRARHTDLARRTSQGGPCTSRCARGTGSLRFDRRASFRSCARRSRRPTSPLSASSTSRSRPITSTSSSRETRPSRSFAGCRGLPDAARRPSTGPPRGEVACGPAVFMPTRSARPRRRDAGSSTSY
jgi:hypothetical protein